jgi:cation:H+ antiporter
VVVIALVVASRRSGRTVKELVLESRLRVELGFLAIASVVAFVIPLTGQISLLLGFALLGFFVFYLWKVDISQLGEQRQLSARARRSDRAVRAVRASDHADQSEVR